MGHTLVSDYDATQSIIKNRGQIINNSISTIPRVTYIDLYQRKESSAIRKIDNMNSNCSHSDCDCCKLN